MKINDGIEKVGDRRQKRNTRNEDERENIITQRKNDKRKEADKKTEEEEEAKTEREENANINGIGVGKEDKYRKREKITKKNSEE